MGAVLFCRVASAPEPEDSRALLFFTSISFCKQRGDSPPLKPLMGLLTDQESKETAVKD